MKCQIKEALNWVDISGDVLASNLKNLFNIGQQTCLNLNRTSYIFLYFSPGVSKCVSLALKFWWKKVEDFPGFQKAARF